MRAGWVPLAPTSGLPSPRRIELLEEVNYSRRSDMTRARGSPERALSSRSVTLRTAAAVARRDVCEVLLVVEERHFLGTGLRPARP
jgi:hypothetical protein